MRVPSLQRAGPACARQAVCDWNGWTCASSVVLEPIEIATLHKGVCDRVMTAWRTSDDADAASRVQQQVDKLLLLVGQRVHDVGRVADAPSSEAALKTVGECVERERRNVFEVLSSIQARSDLHGLHAAELLCALLHSNDRALVGSAFKTEWQTERCWRPAGEECRAMRLRPHTHRLQARALPPHNRRGRHP